MDGGACTGAFTMAFTQPLPTDWVDGGTQLATVEVSVLTASAYAQPDLVVLSHGVGACQTDAGAMSGALGTWTGSWAPASTSDGVEQLCATALWNDGGVLVTSSTTVQVDVTPPTLVWIAPDGGVVHDSVDALFGAADLSSQVAEVDVLAQDGGVAAALTSAPYAATIDLSGVPSGPLTLTAIARDGAGNLTTSQLDVLLDRVPTVSITAPADGGSVTGSFAVSALAADDLGVSGVAFAVDGTSVGQGTTTDGSNYSLQLTTDPYSLGAHTLTATVTDTSGQTAQASSTFDVVDNPPTVSFTSPANNAFVSGDAVQVSFTASDDVGVVGTTVSVNGGAAVAANSPFSLNACLYPQFTVITLQVIVTDTRGQTGSAVLNLRNDSPQPTLTALSGQLENDLTANATCGTPSALRVYYASSAGVTTSDAYVTASAVTNGTAKRTLNAGTREYYAAAAVYSAGVGALSTEATAEARWVCPTANWCVDDPFLGNSQVNAMAENASNDVYAVGPDSSVLHWNGTAWARETLPNSGEDIVGVASNGSTVVAASRAHIYVRGSNGTWTTAYTPASADINSISYVPMGSYTGASAFFTAPGTGHFYWSGSGSSGWSIASWSNWDGGGYAIEKIAGYADDFYAITSVGYDGFGYGSCTPPCVRPPAYFVRTLSGVTEVAPAYGHVWMIASGLRYVDGVDAGATVDQAYCSSLDGGFVGALRSQSFNAVSNYPAYSIKTVAQENQDGSYGTLTQAPWDTSRIACTSGQFRVGLTGGAIGTLPVGGSFAQDTPGVGARWEAVAAPDAPVAGALSGELGHFDIASGMWTADGNRAGDSTPDDWYDVQGDSTSSIVVGDTHHQSCTQFTCSYVHDNAAETWSGSSWSATSAPPITPRSAASIGGVYYVGGTGGSFASYANGSWTTLPSIGVSGAGDVVALAGRNSSDIWAIYENAGINYTAHFTGPGWSTTPSPTTGPTDLWADGSGNVWLVSGNTKDAFYEWNGSAWSTVSSPNGTWTAVGGSGPRDVWLGGHVDCVTGFCLPCSESGLVAHYDGSSWTTSSTNVSCPRRISSGPYGQYLVDGNGVLLHRGE